jgi:NADH:ubiquinone oxidoreductase subunit E
VGACGRAPVSLEDGELVGLMEPAQLLKKLEGWAAND